jgi:hypothetical protein
VMKSPGAVTVVYAPWQGAGRAVYPCRRSCGTLLGSCAPPGRIGWYRPSPVVSPPANIRCPSGTDAAPLKTFQDLYPITSHGRD